MSSSAERAGNVLDTAHRDESERGRIVMAEVSWLSDYVSSNERSADRFGAGAGQGAGGHEQGASAFGGPAFGGPGCGGQGFGGPRFGGQGFAGLLGIGTEGDAHAGQEEAVGAETDPEAVFPEKGGSTREAKKI